MDTICILKYWSVNTRPKRVLSAPSFGTLGDGIFVRALWSQTITISFIVSTVKLMYLNCSAELFLCPNRHNPPLEPSISTKVSKKYYGSSFAVGKIKKFDFITHAPIHLSWLLQNGKQFLPATLKSNLRGYKSCYPAEPLDWGWYPSRTSQRWSKKASKNISILSAYLRTLRNDGIADAESTRIRIAPWDDESVHIPRFNLGPAA